MIYTVFPKNGMPSDFPTYGEAKEYGEELGCTYIIEGTEGEYQYCPKCGQRIDWSEQEESGE